MIPHFEALDVGFKIFQVLLKQWFLLTYIFIFSLQAIAIGSFFVCRVSRWDLESTIEQSFYQVVFKLILNWRQMKHVCLVCLIHIFIWALDSKNLWYAYIECKIGKEVGLIMYIAESGRALQSLCTALHTAPVTRPKQKTLIFSTHN